MTELGEYGLELAAWRRSQEATARIAGQGEMFPIQRDARTDAFVEALENYGAVCPTDVTRFSTVGFALDWLDRHGWIIRPPAAPRDERGE